MRENVKRKKIYLGETNASIMAKTDISARGGNKNGVKKKRELSTLREMVSQWKSQS